jgi:hypothetical protein
MKQIKLYFAGAWSGKCKQEEVELGIRNKLVSFMYPDQLRSWLEVSKDEPGNIMIDSGAFSAWNKGDVVDLDKYIEYAHKAITDGEAAGKKVRVVNLDVIPGKKGESTGLTKNRKTVNKDLVALSAMEGYRNLKTMVKNGIIPIHVFHQGESFIWLDRMAQHTDYVGISPANDLSSPSRKQWIETTFEYMYRRNINVDTHGFAVWIPSILKDIPWTSCDAATWRLLAAWGGIYVPKGGYSHPDYSVNPFILHVSERKSVKGMGILTQEKVKLLEADGFVIEELQKVWAARASINVKYFLEMEKWINKEKETLDYNPVKGGQPKLQVS